MSSFAEELENELRKRLGNQLANDNSMRRLINSISSSTSYDDAYEYASRYGEHLANTIQSLNVDEDWYWGTAMQVWGPSFTEMHEDINGICSTIQANKNKSAKIGIKPQRTKFYEDDLSVLVNKVIEQPALLPQQSTHFAEKIVDRVQKANMQFALDSGIEVVVTRTYDGVGLRRGTTSAESCEFCLSRAGVHNFKGTDRAALSGVFDRHEGCECTIDYKNIRIKRR